MGLGSVVVVPVVSPASARELACVAARVAAWDDGTVVPVSAVPAGGGAAAAAAAEAVVEEAVHAARAQGVAARGVVSDLPVVGAVLACMAEQDATVAVMGWQGASTQRNVFGELIDSIVGRSTIPLAIVRISAKPYERVVLPVSEDHLLPAGGRGLRLAAELARRLQPDGAGPVTILRTGATGSELPAEVAALGDRVHHDRRRVDLAVGAAAGPGDLIVAPVAPTASGLRTATTHMAWAAPDAWLAVAIDVGPQPPRGERLAEAVAQAGNVPLRRREGERLADHVITVAARFPAGQPMGDRLVEALRLVGAVEGGDEPPETDGRLCWRGAVTVAAPSANVAVGAVLTAVHEAEALQGAEVSYDVSTGAGG